MSTSRSRTELSVEIDLIHKGIKTLCASYQYAVHGAHVEIDLIHKGIKTSLMALTMRATLRA